MYRVILWSSNNSDVIQSNGLTDLNKWINDKSYYIWLDIITNDKNEESKILESSFNLHPLAISDAQRDRHQPKYENFDSTRFILLKELSGKSTAIDFTTIQLAIFCGERFIVTRSSHKSKAVNNLWTSVLNDTKFSRTRPDYLQARLSQSISDEYINLLLEVEDKLENIEEKMFSELNDKSLEEIVSYQTHLRKTTRILSYHKNMFSVIFSEIEQLSDYNYKHVWLNVLEHSERAFSLSHLYYGLSSDLIDGYISVSSHRLNQIMKVLTVITVIFVPLSFIAGIYGMNFENMPELKSRSGYFILLGVMLSIAALLLFIFKKRKWV